MAVDGEVEVEETVVVVMEAVKMEAVAMEVEVVMLVMEAVAVVMEAEAAMRVMRRVVAPRTARASHGRERESRVGMGAGEHCRPA
jgi:hypothetical protein